MARLPADPEGFIRANTALERPAMVPEFKLWLASEYVPIWQATEDWLEQQNVDPPYWAFCWPGGQAIARYLLDHPEAVQGKRVIDFAAGSVPARSWPTTSTCCRWSPRGSMRPPTALPSSSAPTTGSPIPRRLPPPMS
jgi:hypothetical protein